MIHKYKYNDKNIVLDVNSGSIHIVDEVFWDVLDFIEKDFDAPESSVVENVSQHSPDKVREAHQELSELINENKLFSKNIYENVNIDRKPVVKALCLHIAHDCNLSCKYCFASEGKYHGERALMSAQTGKQALDFLVKNSGKRKNLEVDFFGGEPTINFATVKEIVEYGRQLEKIHNKILRFTLTTNAVALTDDIIEFSDKNMFNVVLSIDGRKEVNDRMRPDRSGAGSYDRILPNIKKMVENRGERYYVRGTFTRENTDFSKDVLHLYNLGFKQISLEPVVAPAEADYALRDMDIPALLAEYDRLTKIVIDNKNLSFFHFNIDLTGGPCALKRISGCGAGCEYMSVTPDGSLYPCHQFVGIPDFKIGNASDGIDKPEIVKKFSGLSVFSNSYCRECWARFFCSGGCAANAYHSSGKLNSQYEIGCTLQKKRLECAIYIKCLEYTL